MLNKYKKTIITALVVIISVLSVSYLLSNNQSRADKVEEKPKVVKKVDKSTPGDRNLESIITNGKPTVLYFTSEYCRDCIQVKPIIEKLQLTYKDKVDFIIADIRAQDPLSKAAIKKYRVLGVPITVFVKKDGTKYKSLAGYYPEDSFTKQIDVMLEE